MFFIGIEKYSLVQAKAKTFPFFWPCASPSLKRPFISKFPEEPVYMRCFHFSAIYCFITAMHVYVSEIPLITVCVFSFHLPCHPHPLPQDNYFRFLTLLCLCTHTHTHTHTPLCFVYVYMCECMYFVYAQARGCQTSCSSLHLVPLRQDLSLSLELGRGNKPQPSSCTHPLVLPGC